MGINLNTALNNIHTFINHNASTTVPSIYRLELNHQGQLISHKTCSFVQLLELVCAYITDFFRSLFCCDCGLNERTALQYTLRETILESLRVINRSAIPDLQAHQFANIAHRFNALAPSFIQTDCLIDSAGWNIQDEISRMRITINEGGNPQDPNPQLLSDEEQIALALQESMNFQSPSLEGAPVQDFEDRSLDDLTMTEKLNIAIQWGLYFLELPALTDVIWDKGSRFIELIENLEEHYIQGKTVYLGTINEHNLLQVLTEMKPELKRKFLQNPDVNIPFFNSSTTTLAEIPPIINDIVASDSTPTSVSRFLDKDLQLLLDSQSIPAMVVNKDKYRASDTVLIECAQKAHLAINESIQTILRNFYELFQDSDSQLISDIRKLIYSSYLKPFFALYAEILEKNGSEEYTPETLGEQYSQLQTITPHRNRFINQYINAIGTIFEKGCLAILVNDFCPQEIPGNSANLEEFVNFIEVNFKAAIALKKEPGAVSIDSNQQKYLCSSYIVL